MRDEAIQLAQGKSDPTKAMNALREFLQALALRSLHESEAFKNLAFVGGTALRFAHGLRRFSEDLDFSLEAAEGYEPERWLKKLERDMSLAGLPVAIKWSTRTTVHKAWVRWEGVLHDAGLSPHPSQKLSIKLEIDTSPPSGAVCERQIVTRHRILALQTYDLPSLLAGKAHALITRGYPKGRDWYDLLWYLGHRPPVEPNLIQLQNALDQTQGSGICNAHEWKHLSLARLNQIDASQLVADVAPFLEDAAEAAMLTTENLGAVLRER
ncbi:MAG: nucleotidyl transferase AbiEii/AbiGii toxin family protein [Lentisphaerae bacterium]|nr:nucleotidyl transferase AbiEii/AbiGii toxin family protein [Lentisphaerota bacterium]